MSFLQDLADGALVIVGVVLLVTTGNPLGLALISMGAGDHEARRRAEAARRAWEDSLKDIKRMVKSPDAVRNIVIGTERVSGPILFADSFGSGLANITLLVALAGHECNAVTQVYFNDVPVNVDGAGNIVNGEFAKGSQVYHIVQDLDLSLAGGSTTITIPTTVAFETVGRGTSIIRTFAAATNTSGTTVPGNYSVINITKKGTDGTYASYDATTHTSSFSLPPGVYQIAWDISASISFVNIKAHLGASGQTASSTMITNFPAKWTTSHKLTGIAYLEVTMTYDQDVFGQVGIPNISAVVQGAKTYDWSTSTYSFSNNALRGIAYWLTHPSLGLASSQTNDFNVAEMQDAQAICVEQVQIGASTFQDKYTLDGVIGTDMTPIEIKQKLEEAIAGSISWVGGRWLIRPGKYRAPTINISESDVAPGGFKIIPTPSRTALFNRVIGSFLDPAQSYAVTGAPEVSNGAYLADDNNVESPTSITYAFAKDAWRVQRLASIFLNRNRNSTTISVQLKMSQYDQLLDDSVTVTWLDYGLNATPFEVKSRAFDFASRTVTLVLVLTGSTAYDWSYLSASAPITLPGLSLPRISAVVSPVTGLTVSAVGTSSSAQAGLSIQRISWNVHPDLFVNAGGTINIYNASGQGWTLLASVPGSETSVLVYNLPYGIARIIAIAVNTRGAASPETAIIASIGPDLTAPAPPTTFLATAGTGGFTLSWDNPRLVTTDYRESELRLGTTFAGSTLVKMTGALSEFIPWPAVGSYTYRLRHWDWSDNVSTETTAAITVTAQQALLSFNSGEITPDLLFVNLLDATTWGQVVNGWTYYNNNTGNSKAVAVMPTGEQQDVWVVSWPAGQAATSWRGGFVSPLAPIDPNKAYRFVLPFRVTSASADGYCYMGVLGSAVCNINTTTVNSNFYLASAMPLASMVVGRWYYLISYIYPAGATGYTTADEGIYDSVTGMKTATSAIVSNWLAGVNQVQFRAGYYNSPTASATAGIAQFGKPMFSVSDGRQHSLAGIFAAFGTANYRNDVVPTNGGAFGTVTSSATADGNIVASIGITYTQGAVPADTLYLYYREGGGTVVSTDPCVQVSPGPATISLTIKPSTVYTFGLQASRRTDSGMRSTSITTSGTLSALAGNYTGNVASTAAATVASATTNFNLRNDRNAAAIVTPSILTDGTAIDHVVNLDGSVDVSFEWLWAGTPLDIDGFKVYMRSSTVSTAYTMGTSPAQELVFIVTNDKRVMFFQGMAANNYYWFGVQAYRNVDHDINANEVILSTLVQCSLAAENPYQPATTVAFAGNITGTVNGIPAAAVNTWAAVTGIPYETIFNNDDSVAMGFNPTFNWKTGAYPTNWSNWTGAAPTKETSIVRIGTEAMRWAGVTGANAGAFCNWQTATAPLPLDSYLAGSLDVYLSTVTSGLPGMLVRVMYNSAYTAYTDTYVQPPSSTTGAWQRIPWTARVPTGSQIYRIQIFVMASFTSMPSGAFTGDVIFDNLRFMIADGVSNAAYIGTTNYRNTGAPTNNATLGTPTSVATVDGGIVATVSWTYTQGALAADTLYVYFKEGGGTVTTADPCVQKNPITGSLQFSIKPGVAYTFGIQAGRRVDTGMAVTAIATSTTLAALNGNYTGAVNSVAATVITTATSNFNNRNDRLAALPVAPTIATDGTAIDHTINPDGSADISFEWLWSGANADIDGFRVFIYQSNTSGAYTIGTIPALEQLTVLAADKRVAFFFGVAADKFYTFAVQAFRVVDPDVTAAWIVNGVAYSNLVQASLAAENPYQPATSVAFSGNITGTVNGIPASSVNVWGSIAGRPQVSGNLIVKGNFEDASLGGWTGAANISVTGVTWTRALAISQRDTLETGNMIPVSVGDVIYMEADVATGPTQSCTVGAFGVTATGATVNWYPCFSPPANTAWARYKGSFTVPATVAFIYPWLQVNATSAFNTHWLANLVMTKGVPTGQLNPGAATDTAYFVTSAPLSGSISTGLNNNFFPTLQTYVNNSGVTVNISITVTAEGFSASQSGGAGGSARLMLIGNLPGGGSLYQEVAGVDYPGSYSLARDTRTSSYFYTLGPGQSIDYYTNMQLNLVSTGSASFHYDSITLKLEAIKR